MTARAANFWSTADGYAATFSNGRRTDWQYDAAGNATNDSNNTYVHDAAGRNFTSQAIMYANLASQWFDGDGQVIKRSSDSTGTRYYLHSSVLSGKVVTEFNLNGDKAKGYVFALGDVVAEQNIWYTGGPPTEDVRWLHTDPITGSQATSYQTVGGSAGYIETELDPMGVDTGFEDPANYPPPPPEPETPTFTGVPSNPFGPKCTLNGFPLDWRAC